MDKKVLNELKIDKSNFFEPSNHTINFDEATGEKRRKEIRNSSLLNGSSDSFMQKKSSATLAIFLKGHAMSILHVCIDAIHTIAAAGFN